MERSVIRGLLLHLKRCSRITLRSIRATVLPFRPRSDEGLSEQSGAAAQSSGAVAISEPDVAAAGRGVRAIIDLIVGAAVVGTNEVAIVIAAMVLMPAQKQRHRGQT